MKANILLLFISLIHTTLSLPTAGYKRTTGAKRGLIYQSVSDTKPFVNTIPSWAYNYGTSSGGLTGFEYVPMLRDPGQYNSAAVNNINSAISSGSAYLLGYNEPDIASGANLSPQSAASSYKTQLTPFSGRIKLGAPAVTSSTASGAGISWLKQFNAVCAGQCKVDFVPLHWASSSSTQSGATQGQAFISYMTSAISQVNGIYPGLPIWVTELAAQPLTNQQVNADFLNTVVPWLKGQSAIFRFSYYGDFQGQLVSGTSLTQTGQIYANTP